MYNKSNRGKEMQGHNRRREVSLAAARHERVAQLGRLACNPRPLMARIDISEAIREEIGRHHTEWIAAKSPSTQVHYLGLHSTRSHREFQSVPKLKYNTIIDNLIIVHICVECEDLGEDVRPVVPGRWDREQGKA